MLISAAAVARVLCAAKPRGRGGDRLLSVAAAVLIAAAVIARRWLRGTGGVR